MWLKLLAWLTSKLPFLGTATTFLSNFGLPALVLCLSGAAVGGFAGFWITSTINRHNVAELKEQIASLRATALETEVLQTRRAMAHNEKIAAIESSVLRALRESDQATARELLVTRRLLKEEFSDAKWACLNLPVSPVVRERLCRPGDGDPRCSGERVPTPSQ